MIKGVVLAIAAGVVAIAPAYTYAVCDAIHSTGAQFTLSSSLPQSVPGATIGLMATSSDSGGIFSDDLTLAVQVAAPNGAIVDRFFALRDMKDGDHSFAWKIPTGLTPGTYTVTGILVPEKTSYGDVFTNTTLSQASVPIAITSDTATRTYIVPSSITAIPQQDGSVLLGVTIQNDADWPYDGEITWRVWTDQTAFNREPVLTQTLPAKVHPHTADSLKLVIPKAQKGMYYVEAKSTDSRFTSYVEAWIVDGKIPADLCATVSSQPPSTARLWQALGLIILLMLVGLAWNRIHHTERKD